MNLEQRHIDALDKAETLIFHCDFCPYLELKEMLPISTDDDKKRFQLLFSEFYDMGTRKGLSKEFIHHFFEILFTGEVFANGEPDFSRILIELNGFPGKRGSSMQFSFVSKLVAMHRESSPIYDSRVLEFFNEVPPSASVDRQKRIAWFVSFLKCVSDSYADWAHDERVIPIINKLKARDKGLAQCHVNRILDLLVWKAINQKLLVNL